MATLGKCLLFYLKYPTEMERLCGAEEPDVDGLPDADETLEKIRLVGEAADEEVGEILETCATGIENHLAKISNFKRTRRDWRVHWGYEYRVWPRKSEDGEFELGWYINVFRKSVVPWVFCRGKRTSEDEVVRILGRGIKATNSDGLLEAAGAVALAEITIPVSRDLTESIASERVIAEVQSAFTWLTAKHVSGLAAIAGRRRP